MSHQNQLASIAREEDVLTKERISESELYHRLSAMIESGAPCLKDNDWKEIDEMTNGCYPDFKSRLFSICKLSTQEYRICLLVKLGMHPSEIARLTKHSKESITATRRRMYKKFFGTDGMPKDCDDFILAL